MRVALLDRCSIGLSVLCLLHCLALPILISTIPVFATFAFADENFHIALVILVLPTSAIALSLGCRLHGNWRIIALGFAGVTSLVVAIFAAPLSLGEAGETLMTVLGAIFVACAHALNYRTCRARHCEHD